MFVNFDLDILKLLRETKALQRLDLEVPAAAITVTIQEAKLKVHIRYVGAASCGW